MNPTALVLLDYFGTALCAISGALVRRMRLSIPFLFGLTLVSLAAASFAATCAREPRTEAGVRLVEQRWVAAREHRNSAALACILDPRFADSSWRGELIGRAEVMKALPKRTSSRLLLSHLHPMLIGNVAIMRGINTQMIGAEVIGSVRFVDVFAYRSGRWQALSAQETPVQARGSDAVLQRATADNAIS